MLKQIYRFKASASEFMPLFVGEVYQNVETQL